MSDDYVPALVRKPAAKAILTDLRHSEMQTMSERLGRLGDFSWAPMWGTVATLIGGAVLGGAIGLVPFYSSDPRPKSGAQLAYLVALGVGILITGLCFAAHLTTRAERAESVGAIKEDLDKMLGSYEELPGPASTVWTYETR